MTGPADTSRPPADSRLGSGAWIFTPAFSYLAVSWVISVHAREVFEVGAPRVWYAAGGVLMVAGAAAYVRGLSVLRGARRSGALARTGPFRRARHPLYSAWLFYVVPGVCLVSRSWLVMLTPLVLYACVRAFVGAEEARLRRRFGAEYGAYAERTPRLSPWLFH